MEKRTKGWRVQQRKKHYVRNLKKYSNGSRVWIEDENGQLNKFPTWKDLYRANWLPALRTCRTPCSCMFCRGERYDRNDYKRDTRDELNMEFD